MGKKDTSEQQVDRADRRSKGTKAKAGDRRAEGADHSSPDKAARKAAKKAAKRAAKSPIALLAVRTIGADEPARSSYDPVARALDLSLPGGPSGPAGPRGLTGHGIDLSRAPADGLERKIYVDELGRLCYRMGHQDFFFDLTPRE